MFIIFVHCKKLYNKSLEIERVPVGAFFAFDTLSSANRFMQVDIIHGTRHSTLHLARPSRVGKVSV